MALLSWGVGPRGERDYPAWGWCFTAPAGVHSRSHLEKGLLQELVWGPGSSLGEDGGWGERRRGLGWREPAS